MNIHPTDEETEVDIQFKVQVVAKVITMAVLVITMATVYFRNEAINQFIRQLDYWMLGSVALLAVGFWIVGLWQRSNKTGYMLARWGWPVSYTAASLLLTFKYFNF